MNTSDSFNISVLKKRIQEAIAWCAVNDQQLRTPGLCPPMTSRAFRYGSKVLRENVHFYGGQELEERQRLVSIVSDSRTKSLREQQGFPDSAMKSLKDSGRLLAFDPDQTLSDGAAELASQGFFDSSNVPPWDTWLFYTREQKPSRTGRWNSYLLSWVPINLIDGVDDGIIVNPEGCIVWANELQNDFINKYRKAQLL